MTTQFFTDQESNVTTDPVIHNGGSSTVYIWGTFDGATVKLQVSPNGSKWFDLDSLTASTEIEPLTINFSQGDQLRGVVESAGASTSVNLWVT